MVVQWLGLCSFTTIAPVQFLVGELKSHKPHGMTEKNRISPTPDLILFRKNSGLKNKLKDIVKKESNSKDHSLDN